MIEFESVTVRYPHASEPALTAVSLSARAGVVTAVVGPNGSGKTTLIRALLRRVPVQAGRVLVGGDDVASMDQLDVARRLAVVVQREEPVFSMRVQEYVALGRHPHLGAWSRVRDDDAAVERALSGAGIMTLARRVTDTLSGGEWQRVRIARALAQESPAIVLDEPTTFLDIAHEMETFELLSRLAAHGRAVLVVSHQLNLVTRFARHVVLLHRGRVAASGAPDDVMDARTLEAIYEWPLVVARNPATGTPALVPLRRRS